jgi:hypothetical protein
MLSVAFLDGNKNITTYYYGMARIKKKKKRNSHNLQCIKSITCNKLTQYSALNAENA